MCLRILAMTKLCMCQITQAVNAYNCYTEDDGELLIFRVTWLTLGTGRSADIPSETLER